MGIKPSISKLESFYFHDIKKYALLTKREERKLIKQAQENVPGALNRLVKANLRFVVKIAQTYKGKGLELSDLINEGNRGLIKAVTHYKLKKRVKFISYAVYWIRHEIHEALFNTSRTIRLPVNKVILLRSFKKVLESSGCGNFNEAMSDKQFRDQEFEVINALEKTKTVSIETPILSDSEEKTLQDTLSIAAHQDKEMHEKDLAKLLDEALQKVPVREERIVRMYFGINYERTFTLEEIGQTIGLTRERVRMLRDKALHRLICDPMLKKLMEE